MKQLLFIARIYQVKNTEEVEVSNPIHLYTLQELQSLIMDIFPGEKTYLTKESDSKESLIKSTTDLLKFIHLIEIPYLKIERQQG
jgi:hypothetical protein